MKINKISDIIPLIKAGELTLKEIGAQLTPPRKEATMWKYTRILRKAGYDLTIKRGRKPLKI